uniref:Uncharacterized protein n=1 Tax=Thermogemmatispora argillosa TaxID=2045280 RepID=A0A455T217_9CHLR|nr:hypothetical protein KTA_15980 [Thermogemmatispora argillosa]
MGFIRPVGPTDSSSSANVVSYSPEHMRQTAARILAEVHNASQQHTTTWQQVQNWLNTEVDPEWADVMRACLAPYAQRLHASYAWLTDLAQALFAAADFLNATDENLTNAFQPLPRLCPLDSTTPFPPSALAGSGSFTFP